MDNKLRFLIGDLTNSDGHIISTQENWKQIFKRSGHVSDRELEDAGLYEETYCAGDASWNKANDRKRGDIYSGLNVERVILEWRTDKKQKEEMRTH